jgi:hypothetical protein
MVDCREREVWSAHGPVARSDRLERLGRGHLVDEMEVDVDKSRLVVVLMNDVGVPHFVEQRSRTRHAPPWLSPREGSEAHEGGEPTLSRFGIYDAGVSSLLAILAVVLLASPFGTATATAIDDSKGLTVEVSVEYSGAASAIIARPFSDFEELPPTALVEESAGTWIGWVELPTAQNWQIAFEAFELDGVSNLSDGSTLIELGVDAIVIKSDVDGPLPSKPLLPAGSIWLIAGVVAMVAALVLLAFWTFGSWGEAGDEEEEAGTTTEEAASPEDSASRELTNGRE